MDKVNVELSEGEYLSVHFLLHKIIQLTDGLANGVEFTPTQYKNVFAQINEPLKNIKTILDIDLK